MFVSFGSTAMANAAPLENQSSVIGWWHDAHDSANPFGLWNALSCTTVCL